MLLLGSCYFCPQKRCRAKLAFFFKHVQLVANYRQIWTKTLNMLHLVRIKEQFLIKMPTLEIYRGINVSKYHQGTHANTRLNIFSLLTRMFIKEIGARAWWIIERWGEANGEIFLWMVQIASWYTLVMTQVFHLSELFNHISPISHVVKKSRVHAELNVYLFEKRKVYHLIIVSVCTRVSLSGH